jgi:hypothetical protein
MKLLIVQLSHSPVSSLFGANILLRTLLSNTLSLFSSLNVRDQVSHPYKITGRIMVLYILTSTFLDSELEFSRYTATNTKYRSRLSAEHGMGTQLPNTVTDFKALVDSRQMHLVM